VYAVDVGEGQLHWRLRRDDRVTVMEGVNARNLRALPEPVDLVTIDVSFISLGSILPAASSWLQDAGQVIALIKPQFEARPAQVKKGGVVREKAVRREIVERLMEAARAQDLHPAGLTPSPLKGPKGNVEFLLWLTRAKSEVQAAALLEAVFAH
jgi:23S rRNA (cytidine1920-2'-O)/16S rRNA (cytidine1409-2'-O)-methyltransferase